MFALNKDEILEKLSFALPMGLGRAHAGAIAKNLDKTARSCLDIGCGRGVFKSMKELYAIGCDIYQPALEIAKEKGYYQELIMCDVRYLPFEAKSFDVAICVEVIEHLEKPDGLKLIKRMEEIACKQVIIMTPWGICPVEERGDNPSLAHISAWLPDELEAMGYRTYPFYYSRYPLGSKISRIIARYIITILLYPLIRLFPARLAQDFVAVKEIH